MAVDKTARFCSRAGRKIHLFNAGGPLHQSSVTGRIPSDLRSSGHKLACFSRPSGRKSSGLYSNGGHFCLLRLVGRTPSRLRHGRKLPRLLCLPAWWQSFLRRCFQELTLLQRFQLSVIGGSILASVSNSKGGENLFSKPSIGGT